MKFFAIGLSLITAFIVIGEPACATSAMSATPSIRTVQSSHPPYVADVANERLISIRLQPQALKLDMNAVNSIKSEAGDDFKPARYTFPAAHVPRSVLSHLSGIYGYDRRRDVPIVSSGGDWVIAEYFRAGSHIPVTRFQLLGKQVQRQEQLDQAGRTVRLIVVGWARASDRDDEASDLSRLGEHPAWIRVFDVLPGGKKQLVALAWRKTRFQSAPDTYDAPKDNELAYGLPNGLVKWQTMEQFTRAEHIDLDARSLAGNPRRQPSRM